MLLTILLILILITYSFLLLPVIPFSDRRPDLPHHFIISV